jgi:hypothetical protein
LGFGNSDLGFGASAETQELQKRSSLAACPATYWSLLARRRGTYFAVSVGAPCFSTNNYPQMCVRAISAGLRSRAVSAAPPGLGCLLTILPRVPAVGGQATPADHLHPGLLSRRAYGTYAVRTIPTCTSPGTSPESTFFSTSTATHSHNLRAHTGICG